jgi:hypothetical protein
VTSLRIATGSDNMKTDFFKSDTIEIFSNGVRDLYDCPSEKKTTKMEKNDVYEKKGVGRQTRL